MALPAARRQQRRQRSVRSDTVLRLLGTLIADAAAASAATARLICGVSAPNLRSIDPILAIWGVKLPTVGVVLH